MSQVSDILNDNKETIEQVVMNRARGFWLYYSSLMSLNPGDRLDGYMVHPDVIAGVAENMTLEDIRSANKAHENEAHVERLEKTIASALGAIKTIVEKQSGQE